MHFQPLVVTSLGMDLQGSAQHESDMFVFVFLTYQRGCSQLCNVIATGLICHCAVGRILTILHHMRQERDR